MVLRQYRSATDFDTGIPKRKLSIISNMYAKAAAEGYIPSPVIGMQKYPGPQAAKYINHTKSAGLFFFSLRIWYSLNRLVLSIN